MLSGLACLGPGAVSAGAGLVWSLLLSSYTLAALVTLPPLASFLLSLPLLFSSLQSVRLPFNPCRAGAAFSILLCFSLLYPCFPRYILRYSLFFGLFAPLFSPSVCLILSFCLSFFILLRRVLCLGALRYACLSRVFRGGASRVSHVRLFARACAYIMRCLRYNVRGGWKYSKLGTVGEGAQENRCGPVL